MNKVHIVITFAICCSLQNNVIAAESTTAAPSTASPEKTTEVQTDAVGSAADFVATLMKSFDEAGMSDMTNKINKIAVDVAKTEINKASENNGTISPQVIVDDLPNIVKKYAKNVSHDFFQETVVKPAASGDSQDNLQKLVGAGSSLFMKMMEEYQKSEDNQNTESTTAKSDISTPVNESTTEKSPSSTEQPPSSTEQQPLSTEQPPSSTEQPPTSTEQPPTSTEEPPSTTENPPSTTETTVAITDEETTESAVSTEESSADAETQTTPPATS